MKLQFAQVTSRCLFTTTPCSFVSSLSSVPLTQRVSSTPFHLHAHLSFPHPSSLAVPLNTVVHGHVRSQYPRKIITPRSGCTNARLEWPFLCFGCAGMTLQTTRSLFPTTSRVLSWNASVNDADRCCMLLHTTRHAEAMIRGPRSRRMGYAARGPLTYTLCPNAGPRAIRGLVWNGRSCPCPRSGLYISQPEPRSGEGCDQADHGRPVEAMKVFLATVSQTNGRGALQLIKPASSTGSFFATRRPSRGRGRVVGYSRGRSGFDSDEHSRGFESSACRRPGTEARLIIRSRGATFNNCTLHFG